MRSLETGKAASAEVYEKELLRQRLITPNPDRLGYILFAFRSGYTIEQVRELTAIDPWFLREMRSSQALASSAKKRKKSAPAWMRAAPQIFSVFIIRKPQARPRVSVLASMKGIASGCR